MKKFTLTGITAMALVTGLALSALADTSATSTTDSGGNQLMQNQTHWYQKAATQVGPADPSVKGGLVLQAGSMLYLEGDSTLHKYQMNAHVLLGSAALKSPKADFAQSLKNDGVDSMTLVVPVNNLKSRESGLDDNAYKALQAKENPSIKFVLESETLKDDVMSAQGSLSIAGVTVPVTLSAQTEIKGDQIRLKGVQKLKMSDYQVKPPSISLVVTSITCTDEIEIHYDVVFAPAAK
jgi:polyisoprenoid-binding protein YceI